MTQAPATLDSLAAALAELREQLATLLHRLDAGPQRWLTITSAAHYCDLSEESIRRLIAAGRLQPHRPVRGRVLVDRHELDSLVRSSTARLRVGRGLGRGAGSG